ncbi:uncharacterized protein LOC143225466 [Tachypleus tridentatus]|uniref:uncharacterized protein LOC143225466 n=1 Tax=Tachypleus tridentatus TaxID=6853 RepID=UPI003FD5441D
MTGCVMDECMEGVALLVDQQVPTQSLPLDTLLDAVAIHASLGFAITVCSLYLALEEAYVQSGLDALIEQLPFPFLTWMIFNEHYSLWSCADIDGRGRSIEYMLLDHNLSFFNTGSYTYFSAINQSFTAVGLSVCSPSIFSYFSWRVDSNPQGSDHFAIILREIGHGRRHLTSVSQWKLDQANWPCFTVLWELDPDVTCKPIIND